MAHGNTRLARQLIWIAGFLNAALLCGVCTVTAQNGDGGPWFLLLLLAVDVAVSCYALSQGLIFELLKERSWKAVCLGLGGNFVSSRIRIHANPFWVFGGPLIRPNEQLTYPKLRDVHGTHDSWTGTVIPFAGQTIETYSARSDAFALAFHVPFVTFGLAENGLISIRAGNVPVPEAYEYEPVAAPASPPRTHVLAPAVPKQPVVKAPVPALPVPHQVPVDLAELRTLLRRVPMARDMQDRIWSMPIEGRHALIAARTGGGKNSLGWSLVLSLAPAWRAGLVTFWGCDPKRLELAIGRDWFTHYADTPEDMVALLEQCVKDMHERASELQGKVRKFTPSRETPLHVVIVDELGYLTVMLPDRKLRARAEEAIVTLLSQGRALGYAVVAMVQDPRKETVAFRDLFPIRIAGGLPAPMVDLVLGDGMHDAGAYCELLPLGDAGAGVAYVVDETSLKPLLIRAAWCDDRIIQRLLTEAMTASQYPDVPMSSQLDWNGQPLYQWGYRGE